MKSIFRMAYVLLATVILTGCATTQGGSSCSTGACPSSEKAACSASKSKCDAAWVSLLNGKDLSNWNATGTATWSYKDGLMIGTSTEGKGHIYAGPEMTDMEVRGRFRLTSQGKNSNSGLYFRAKPTETDPESWPTGYEAQICHSQDAHTGYMWKPGNPIGKATKLLTKDGEWFDMRAQVIGGIQKIWVNDELVMTFDDTSFGPNGEYTSGNVAIQVHNAGMTIEIKELSYRDLTKCDKK